MGAINTNNINGATYVGGIYDFDSCHRTLQALLDILQTQFKEETEYKRPLITPQGNIVYALDSEIAEKMMTFMSHKLMNVVGFNQEEFRFIRKSQFDDDGLQRMRLDFTNGINASVIHKIESAMTSIAA